MKCNNSLINKIIFTIDFWKAYLRIDGSEMNLRHSQVELLHGNILLNLISFVEQRGFQRALLYSEEGVQGVLDLPDLNL